MTDFVVVLITASSPEEGRTISRRLVEQRLCACVNVLPGIRSTYWWEGEIQEDGEVLLVCKARREDFGGIEREVKRLHSYDVPEIIALPILQGSAQYLDWISNETEKRRQGT